MGTTQYLWSSVTDNIVEEFDDLGATQVSNTHLPELNGELVAQHDTATHFHHYDDRGSTAAITDDAGNVGDEFEYNAYGEEVAHTGVSETPYRFQGAYGYYNDVDLGSIYIRRRTYEPATGRWASTDPLGFVDGANLYRAYFVAGGVDPSGEYKRCVCSWWVSGPRSFRISLQTIAEDGEDCGVVCDRNLTSDYEGRLSCARYKSEPFSQAKNNFLALCDNIDQTLESCSGCTKELCLEAVFQFIRASEKAWVIKLGFNTCERWANNCHKRLPKDIEDNPCVAMAVVQTVDKRAWGGLTTDHFFTKMLLCNGQGIYADNGVPFAVGGKDHLFTSEELAEWYNRGRD